MSDPVTIAVLVAIPPTVAAIAGLVVGLVNKKSIDVLTINVNGRLGELLKLTEKSSKAEGIKEERDRTN